MLSLMALTPSSWEQQPRVGSRIRRQLCFDDSGSCSSKPSGGALGRSAVLGCLLLLFCAGCLVPTSYFTALRLLWGRGQGAPAAAQLTARGARRLIQTSDPAADTWLGEEWEQQRQLVTERQQQQEQQQGGLPGTGGINSAAVAEQAELQRGPPVPLAHNLSASVPREAVLGLYNQQLHTLLQHTPQLLRWVEPRARHRFCFPCIKGPGAQVALVGNGPLSAEQRERIAQADCVLRFNRINNRDWGREERTDVWVVRGSAGSNWHLPKWASKLREGVKSVVLAHEFLRGTGAAQWVGVQSRMRPHYPWMEQVEAFAKAMAYNASEGAAKLLPLELGGLVEAWNSFTLRLGYTWRASVPSTGLVGALAVLECLPLDGTLHVYGFNWSPDAWEGHLLDVEGSLLRLLAQQGAGAGSGALVIHQTPCSAYMRCDGA